MKIEKNNPASKTDIDIFLFRANFKLPSGYIDFMTISDGAAIETEENSVILWSFENIAQRNKALSVEEYAPDFILIGSDGGGESFAMEKSSGYIYMLPFIGLLREDAELKGKSFQEFLDSL